MFNFTLRTVFAYTAIALAVKSKIAHLSGITSTPVIEEATTDSSTPKITIKEDTTQET